MSFELVFQVCCGNRVFIESIASANGARNTERVNKMRSYDTSTLDMLLCLRNRIVRVETCHLLRDLFTQQPSTLIRALLHHQRNGRMVFHIDLCQYVISQIHTEYHQLVENITSETVFQERSILEFIVYLSGMARTRLCQAHVQSAVSACLRCIGWYGLSLLILRHSSIHYHRRIINLIGSQSVARFFGIPSYLDTRTRHVQNSILADASSLFHVLLDATVHDHTTVATGTMDADILRFLYSAEGQTHVSNSTLRHNRTLLNNVRL